VSVNVNLHHHQAVNRAKNPAIFAKSQTLDGPSWLDLIGEGLAVLRNMRPLPRRIHLGPVPLGDGHPVMVLPAFLCSDHMSRGVRDWLAALGYEVEGWGAGVNIGPTAGAVAAVDAILRRITEASGRKASLVGVSLGGVLARALANAHPDRFYRALAPLHGGAHQLLEQLTAPPPVPTTAIYAPKDGIVAWRSCVDLPGPNRENVAIEGAHHTTMLANPKTLRVIAERLALPEEAVIASRQ
jgi:pimeloyl-ACP methyl ester carboxylesterase